MLVIKQLTPFHSFFFSYWDVMATYRQLLMTFFKISYFVFNRRKKLAHGWNNIRVI